MKQKHIKLKRVSLLKLNKVRLKLNKLRLGAESESSYSMTNSRNLKKI